MVFPVAGIIMGGIQAATGVAKLIGGKKAKKKAEEDKKKIIENIRLIFLTISAWQINNYKLTFETGRTNPSEFRK